MAGYGFPNGGRKLLKPAWQKNGGAQPAVCHGSRHLVVHIPTRRRASKRHWRLRQDSSLFPIAAQSHETHTNPQKSEPRAASDHNEPILAAPVMPLRDRKCLPNAGLGAIV